MPTITLHTHDSSDETKAQFNDLIQDTFGFSFQPWFERQGWPADYTAYAIHGDGQMLANVSVYRMEMLVHGQPRTMYQIGAVATRREYRGQGLSRQILQHILDRHPGGTFFLCANESVLDFYPRFGFVPVQERQPCIQLPPGPALAEGVRRLSIDDPRFLEYLNHRTTGSPSGSAFSGVLDCTNAAPIQHFHLLGEYTGCLYEIPALEALLVAEPHPGWLTLVEVFARRPLAFDQLAHYLRGFGFDTLRFGFNPDGLGIAYESTAPEEDSHLFVRGEWGVRGDFLLPLLIRT